MLTSYSFLNLVHLPVQDTLVQAFFPREIISRARLSTIEIVFSLALEINSLCFHYAREVRYAKGGTHVCTLKGA